MAEPPTVQLDYGKPQRALLSTLGMAIGAPIHCGSDGSILFTAVSFGRPPDPPALKDFSLYALKPEAEGVIVVRYGIEQSGLRQIRPTGAVAVSDTRVAMIVEALTPEEEWQDKNRSTHPFLLLFDRAGTFLHASALDPVVGVPQIGLLKSGDLFAVGFSANDTYERHLHWRVIDENGTVQRDLTPAQDASTGTYASNKDVVSALNSGKGIPQIVSYRDHLLLLEMNTSKPILEINEHGVMRSIVLQLPKGENLGSIIPSNGGALQVRLGHTATGASTENGAPPGFLYQDKIAEFDPNTGELLRYVNPGRDHFPAALACEHDGDFLAMKTDPKDGTLLIERASSAR